MKATKLVTSELYEEYLGILQQDGAETAEMTIAENHGTKAAKYIIVALQRELARRAKSSR